MGTIASATSSGLGATDDPSAAATHASIAAWQTRAYGDGVDGRWLPPLANQRR